MKKPAVLKKANGKATASMVCRVLSPYRKYLVTAILLGVVFTSMYGLVQQLGRMQANDTPTLLATQVAKQLDAKLGIESVNMGATNLANNPVPFVIIYDKDGKAVGGSGYLDNQLAVVPKGVLGHAKIGANNEVTWQPRSGVRIAAVVVAANDYKVLGGQSLAATEKHASRLLRLAGTGYAASIIVLIAYALLRKFVPKI